MPSLNQKSSQFMITKEIFIKHTSGQIQKDYQIDQKPLGQGGFGTVFQGTKKKAFCQANTKENLQSQFSSLELISKSRLDCQKQARAIKKISIKRKEDKELIKNQIEILSYLDHPLIVRLYQIYVQNKELYLVIDLLKGGDLFTVISQNDRMTEAQAKIVFVQIIKALRYLHAQHISHRDLKLENILFQDSHSYRIKIVDFGLAFCWDQDMKRQLREKGLHKKITGTPDYMSPEMLTQSYDQRCDIWSAGVILYILLSGVTPFQGQNDKEIISRIKKLEYSLEVPEIDHVSEQAKDLIRGILKPDYERLLLDEILSHPWLSQVSCLESSLTCKNKTFLSPLCLKQNIKLSSATDIQETNQHLQMKRKNSQTTEDNSEIGNKCKSGWSDQYTQNQRPQKLSIKKMEHYCKLSKLQKLQAIFSVSQLNQKRIYKFAKEFLRIDHDNDGTISLTDLQTYLDKAQSKSFEDKIKIYFNNIDLSNRGHISYSQYLACVLSYQSDSDQFFSTKSIQLNKKSFQSLNSSVFPIQKMKGLIDIFDDSMLLEFFCFLDKNNDGFITKKDFICLLEENGIKNQNKELIQQLNRNFNQKPIKNKLQWYIDPRTYKWQLSRTYKGQSDGGVMISLNEFKNLMSKSE